MITEDAIQEYLHGISPRSGVTAIESAIDNDPGLAARVMALQRQNKLLQELRVDILDEPVPERLMFILRGAELPAARHQASLSPAPLRVRLHGRHSSARRAALLVLIIAIGIGIVWAAYAVLRSLQTT